MSRWKELPDSADQRVRQLVVQLRRLKDRSGLSLASLATRTGYSRSSWNRYLNGKALPPRHAVEQLAQAAGADPIRLLVLHEVAEEVWQQRRAPSGAGEGGGRGSRSEETAEGCEATEDSVASAERSRAPGVGPVAVGTVQPPGVRKHVALAAVVAAALAGVGAGMLIPAPWGHGDGGGHEVRTAVASPLSSTGTTSAAPGPGRYVFAPGKSYPCKVRRDGAATGGLFAGYSTTRTAVLAGPGWNVVEAQCLLGYHRMEPGIVDGVYGQQTIAAVMRLQKKAGLPADGVVGPHTWRVLRG